jgi:hypothetical protein
MKKLRIAVAGAILAMGVAGTAAADTNYSFDFGTLFSSSGPSPVPTFANLAVSTADFLTFSFDLKIGSNLNSVFASLGSNPFVGSLQVNTFGADPLGSTIASGSWGVTQVKQNNQSNSAGGVSWDFTDALCGSGPACNPNNTGSRLTQGEEVKWNVTFSSVQNPPFDTPAFLLKVQTSGGSAEYIPATPVPEPEIFAMLTAGLGLMGFVARRRKREIAA